MAPKKTLIGWEVPEVEDADAEIVALQTDNLSFGCIGITRPERQQAVNESIAHKKPVPPLNRPDAQIFASEFDSITVARVSSWLKLDSPNADIRKGCETALRQELDYAEHLGLPAILLPPAPLPNQNFACFMNAHFHNYTTSQYWLRVPLSSGDHDLAANGNASDAGDSEWKSWNTFRLLCDHSVKLYVALELTADLPEQHILDRWLGEPVKAVIIPTSLFLTNAKGFPVLSKPHQKFLKALLKYNVQVVLSGDAGHDQGRQAYQGYISFLDTRKDEGAEDPLGEFAQGYEDYLQSPLQPLADNLESGTYEVFEKDPVKYREYQRAVYQALVDRVPDDKKDDVVTIIMVVGAGRGPLVKASLMAAEKARRKVKVWAVEKNPNAIIYLQGRVEREWGDSVTLVATDMRDFAPAEKADILVSELLGSFGDNELSPECLDGVQHVLKDDGISIPCASTSYVAPLMSAKLYNEMRAMKTADATRPYELPYVVYIHNAARIAEPQPMFTFVHPNRETPIDNTRYHTAEFTAQASATLHGIAGYFDTTLYKDIKLSIEPHTYSDGMFSWFPIFFPLKTPMGIREGDVISVHFWRKVDKHKVWYEWCVSSPFVSAVHNPNARSYHIGL